ncbi:hypothetical protein [uncultured Winogradskyella sp.]|uniref:hypothetical protein n=1 Tax=uncultured Winogradskyella sp. TaxID=395353 RepID=UPI00261CB6C0|nr:hypothetical protein [uncultured Winogradskyella sp.]
MVFRASIIILFLIGLIFTSCRTEETEFIQAPEDETLVANSNIALLIQRTASNDGSNDNIVDRANCFDITFPYTVNANNQELTLNSYEDLATIECIFDQSDDDTDSLEIIFPVTIILADFSEVIVTNLTEFNSYSNNCNGENVFDEDIECVDFQYPIEASIFNSNNELLDTININSDNQLYDFVEDIDENDIITIEFPITVILSDNSEIIINNLNELETTIENAENTCDEDDDYDYDDDDCDNCTPTQVEEILTNCNNWEVDKLKRNGADYDDVYNGYDFNFFTDGTMSVYWNSTTVYGTWTTSGSGNNLEVLIDVPSLPLCNNNWIVHEIENCTDETKIDLRVGDDDRLRYENNCN